MKMESQHMETWKERQDNGKWQASLGYIERLRFKQTQDVSYLVKLET